jgi:hypothetical protein
MWDSSNFITHAKGILIFMGGKKNIPSHGRYFWTSHIIKGMPLRVRPGAAGMQLGISAK